MIATNYNKSDKKLQWEIFRKNIIKISWVSRGGKTQHHKRQNQEAQFSSGVCL